jgi:asparagine synthase (glutamine-hydrolysing)
LPARFRQWGPLERAQFLEVTTFLSTYLLSSQGDRMAMANSVEGRYPFLDYRVVEFCNHLPSDLKLRGLREKHLLRRLAARWLPPEICQRRKHPYRAPIYRSFFSDHSPDYVRELLSPDAVRRSGWFKPAAVSQLVAKLDLGKPLGETDDMALAGILSTQLLSTQFVENFQRATPLVDAQNVKVHRRSLNSLRAV